MADIESRVESEVPPDGGPEPELTDLTDQPEGDPNEPDAISRMETTDELAALAEEEKTEDIAPDITTEAVVAEDQVVREDEVREAGNVTAEESVEHGEAEQVNPEPEHVETNAEEGVTSDEPVAEVVEQPSGENADLSDLPQEQATTEINIEAPPENFDGTATAQLVGESSDDQPDSDMALSTHPKVERKVSRARFEPLKSAIEEEESDGDLTNREHRQKVVDYDSYAQGRHSQMTDQGEFIAGSDEEIEEEALPKITRQQMIEAIQQQLAERDSLKLKNQNVQHKLALYFQNKRAEDRGAGLETAGEGEQKYASLLSKYTDLLREKRILDERSREQLDGLRERREQLRSDGEALLTQLRELKKATVLSSISVKTGKAPQWDDVEPQFAVEAKKDSDIHKLLIENIILRNRIHKIEDTMKAKDKLGEGLHMIDFEQLKIENQTYNEKIEERNEDISKLKKKITTSVEVLTHVKEKLEFLRHANEAQKIKLEDVDKTLAVKRSKVSRLKQSRDMLRNDNEKLRQSAGLLGKNDLLRDFENKVDEAELLRRRLADLQVTHAEVSMSSSAINKKINGLKASNPTLTTMTTESAKTMSFHRK